VQPFNAAFSLLTNGVYQTGAIHSYGGNSGGPLCVLSTDSRGRAFFIPAGIYLGGGVAKANVRAIDLDVVDLINRAELSSQVNTNSTSPGVILVTRGVAAPVDKAGWLTVSVGPASAVRLGAAWRISPTNYGERHELRLYTNYISSTLDLEVFSRNFTIELTNIPGFYSPSLPPVVLSEGVTQRLDLYYTVTNPQLHMNYIAGKPLLGIRGTAKTAYQIDTASHLPFPDWTPLTTNLLLAPGINWVTDAVVVPERFYRAVWLPEK